MGLSWAEPASWETTLKASLVATQRGDSGSPPARPPGPRVAARSAAGWGAGRAEAGGTWATRKLSGFARCPNGDRKATLAQAGWPCPPPAPTAGPDHRQLLPARGCAPPASAGTGVKVTHGVCDASLLFRLVAHVSRVLSIHRRRESGVSSPFRCYSRPKLKQVRGSQGRDGTGVRSRSAVGLSGWHRRRHRASWGELQGVRGPGLPTGGRRVHGFRVLPGESLPPLSSSLPSTGPSGGVWGQTPWGPVIPEAPGAASRNRSFADTAVPSGPGTPVAMTSADVLSIDDAVRSSAATDAVTWAPSNRGPQRGEGALRTVMHAGRSAERSRPTRARAPPSP